jgi:hypothetical protein
MHQSMLAGLPLLRPTTLELELRSDDPVAVLLTTIRINAGPTHAQAAMKLDTSAAVVTALESGLVHLSV